jgi:aminobenzoyl-glutamate utilization protein B
MALARRFVCSAASATDLDAASRDAINADVDRYAPRLAAVAQDIWGFAELGFQEHRSSALLQSELKTAGFTVSAGVAGMPTAFVASYRSGPGPVIAILAEFDALAGLSQMAGDPERKIDPARADGHGCGHNLYGAASVAGAIAVKSWMQKNGVSGEVRLYGSPAEEIDSGKVMLVRAGLFKDVDLALHWHPGDRNDASQKHALALVGGLFRFHGASAHAAGAPERARSALDGLESLDYMVNLMREHVPQETRIHYVITNGGKAPNVVPDFAEAYYVMRNPDQKVLVGIVDRIKKAAEGAALGTGTRVEFKILGGTMDTVPNDALGRVVLENLQRTDKMQYSPKEQAYIAALQNSLPAGVQDHSGPTEIVPYKVGDISYSSSDVGDVSYAVPTAGFNIATWPAGTPSHSWQSTSASASTVGAKGAVVAAKVLATAAAQLFQSPDIVAAAKAEHAKRIGPDFVYRSLMGDAKPDLDFYNKKK